MPSTRLIQITVLTSDLSDQLIPDLARLLSNYSRGPSPEVERWNIDEKHVTEETGEFLATAGRPMMNGR